jgi:recombination protein RecA
MMAKEKLKDEQRSQDEAVEHFLAQMTKEYGEKVVRSGREFLDEHYDTIPISPNLDAITGGGIQEGSWVGISGDPKTGKTTMALSLAKNAQADGRFVCYANIEGRLTKRTLDGIKGLDQSRHRFGVIGSTTEKVMTAQATLDALLRVLKDVPRVFIIIDSISVLCDEKELEEGLGKETRGGGAKLFSQFIRLAAPVVPAQKAIVVGITHRIANTSGYGPPKHEKAANAWKYIVDYKLLTTSRDPLVAGDKVIGLKTGWLCETSKNAPPGLGIQSYVRFGVGVDAALELMYTAIDLGLIKQAGAWYSLAFLAKPEHKELLGGADVPRAQGVEKLYHLLAKKPAWTDALRAELVQLANPGVGVGKPKGAK